ncbi:dynein regulatory complex protein 10 isoform X2 [Cebidichthys violaceus]
MSAKEATVLVKTKTQSEDSQKNHEVSQKKLLSHEAQCISSLLENCIGQVEIAATLPALQLNSVSDVVDKELSRAIKEHQILIGRLETLDGLKQESDGEQEGEVGEARAQLEKDIKNSVRDLLRVARVHPDAICGLRAELGMKVGESEYMLIKGLEKFHSHMVEKLLTSLDDEELQQALHKQVSSPPDHNHIDVSVEEEVATAIKQIDAKISRNNNELKKLQRSLKGIKEEPGMSFLADKQYQSHMKSAKMKQTGIQQEIDQLNSQLNNLIPKNRQAEREIQEKNEKLVEELEYMLQIFDNDMEKKQADLEVNGMDYEREEEQLRKLGKRFSALELECNEIQEKRRLADEKRREEMRELELKTKAAILVQAWWRGYITRKSLKNKGKSKKAKKGKNKTK